MFETILITGAAAAGKSTLSRALTKLDGFAVFEYGAVLYQRALIRNPEISHAETRSHSEKFISPEDILGTDEDLQQFIAVHRNAKHIVIDSHAVSKETYGFRIEPFTPGRLKQAAFSRIVFLYCDPAVIYSRTLKDPDGRPGLTLKEAELYQQLQTAVSVNYSTILGIPVHFIDSTLPPDELKDQFLSLIGSKSH